MSRDSERYGISALTTRRSLGAFALIAAVVAVVGIAFVYTAGWLSPGRLTQARVIDRFEQVEGLHPGYRRNHPKGLCFSGWFDSNGGAQALSDAAVFRSGRTPIFGRFSLADGQPYMADTPDVVRAMAVDFELSNGEVWRTAMVNIPVFPVRDLNGFYDQLTATRPDPATGKPDPARVAKFVARHPEAARALGIIMAQPRTSGFADATYNSLNAFRFVNASGASVPVRWSVVPEDPPRAPATAAAFAADRNFLFDQLVSRVRSRPLSYRLVVTAAHPGDPTNDATRAWGPDRRRVVAGVLTISAVQDEDHGACRDVTFDPLILPRGIAASDDPLLSPRSATYSNDFTRRAGEPTPRAPVPVSPSSEGASS